jgi:hypothetical protein
LQSIGLRKMILRAVCGEDGWPIVIFSPRKIRHCGIAVFDFVFYFWCCGNISKATLV